MRNKKLMTAGTLGALAVLLTACGQSAKSAATLKAPTGIFGAFYNWFGRPLQQLMEWIAKFFDSINGYGWAIIIITLAVRLLLLPLMLRQQKNMTASQEKMKVLKPQLDILQKRMKTPGLSQEEQMRINILMREVYSKNNTSMIPSMGCLTLLIQLPIFSGLYQAVAYSPEISSSKFFGIELGQSSMIITIVATLIYVLQSWVMLQGYDPEQRKMMQTSAMLSPIMTFVFCMMYNAGLGLYFLAGGIIFLVQQLILTYLLVPAIRRKMDEEIAKNPPVIVVDEHTFDAPAAPAGRPRVIEAVEGADAPDNNRGSDDHRRNAGKQHRR